MALDKVIKEGKDKGGIPSHIELYPDQAYDLLKEINALHQEESDVTKDIKIEQESQSDFDVRLFLYSKDGLPFKTAKMILNKWFNTEYEITYKDIEIRVVNKPKKPEPPSNRTIWEGFKWPWKK